MTAIRFIARSAMSFALLAGLGSAHAAPDMLTTVASLQAAVNRGDVAAAMAVFGDDIRLQGAQQCTPASPFVGLDQVRSRFYEPIIAQKLQMTALAIQGNSDTVLLRDELRSDLFRERGAERLIIWVEFRLRDGKIVSQSIRYDLSDPASAAYFARWVPAAAVATR